jgi:hypothetical protein
MSQKVAEKQTLVCARILEQNYFALFQIKARLLREEKIRPFDDVLEVRFALRVDKRRHIRDIYSLRSTRD